ncbi:hypothetical protein DV736_g4139, partial [Chaetothyriales sp. CBS 134916]
MRLPPGNGPEPKTLACLPENYCVNWPVTLLLLPFGQTHGFLRKHTPVQPSHSCLHFLPTAAALPPSFFRPDLRRPCLVQTIGLVPDGLVRTARMAGAGQATVVGAAAAAVSVRYGLCPVPVARQHSLDLAGASSSSQRDDGLAFSTQFDEVDRAMDNLVKSGKFYLPGPRRESVPVVMSPSRPFVDYGHRSHGSRHSVSDFDPSRSNPAANLQNFYASQRYQGARQNEPDQMAQAKRRMAQQRERDLRNYHQEQQYNRSLLAEMASNKSDRSMSPSTLSEEGRRELIARQHRALYGNDGSPFLPQSGFSEDQQPASAKAAGPRGQSPRGIDRFGISGQQADATSQAVDNASSPAGPNSAGFNKVPTPPNPDDANHSRQMSKSTAAPIAGGIGPIGSRPTTQAAPAQSLNKATTSPLPSSISYGFASAQPDQANERSNSANSNTNGQKENGANAAIGTWGTGSGVWGSNKIGATSVWG